MEDVNKTKAQLAQELENARQRILELETLETNYKQAVQALRLTQHTIDSSRIPILWVRPDSSIMYANQAQCNMLGYTQEQLTTLNVSDFDPDWSNEYWYAEGWDRIKAEGQWTFESRNQHKDGHIFPVEVTATYGVFEGQEYVFAFTSDITDRKTIENELEKRNQTLMFLQQGMIEITSELDAPTVLRRVTQRAVDLLDADLGGAIYLYNEHEKMLRLTESVGGNRGQIGFTLKPGEGVSGRVFQNHQTMIVNDYSGWDGHIYYNPADPPVAVMGFPFKWGEQVFGVLTLAANAERRTFNESDARLAELFADQAANAYRNAQLYQQAQAEIQERKQVEHQLQQSESRFRALTENITDITIILGEDGRHIYVSPSVTRLLEVKPEDFVGTGPADFVHPDDMEMVEGIITKARQNPGTTIPFPVFRVRHRAGHWIFLDGIVVDMVDVSGVNGLVYNGRDITKRRQLEAEARQAEILRVALEKEKELVALKDRFVALVSHEFRSPLAVIQTTSDVLELYLDRLNQTQREQKIKQIKQQIAHLTRLIDGTLAISQAQQKKINFNPSPLDLASFCSTIFDQIQFTDSAHHQFEFINDAPRDAVFVDGNLLQHVLNNLLTNAVKYSPDGTKITLELTYDDNEITIKIIDEGIGIPQADQSRLFEPFHRAGNVGNAKGTGLGLSIVKEYVELHGGCINVTSKVGEGSTFTVVLPRK